VPDLSVRHATAEDIDAVARLHSDSWRHSYRGIYADALLDGDAVADRLAVWGERLGRASPDHFTLLAELAGAIVGFSHIVLDGDPTFGAVVQNIHVAPSLKRSGIGSRLLVEAARALLDSRRSSGLCVWVREDNAPAQAFYEARGGAPAGRKLGGPFADGGRAPVLRYAWPDAATLLMSRDSSARS
jgi:ribosomal protein S18 acetylase RimI-like enzyme